MMAKVYYLELLLDQDKLMYDELACAYVEAFIQARNSIDGNRLAEQFVDGIVKLS